VPFKTTSSELNLGHVSNRDIIKEGGTPQSRMGGKLDFFNTRVEHFGVKRYFKDVLVQKHDHGGR
jgi:hypothetical protein